MSQNRQLFCGWRGHFTRRKFGQIEVMKIEVMKTNSPSQSVGVTDSLGCLLGREKKPGQRLTMRAITTDDKGERARGREGDWAIVRWTIRAIW